MKNLFSLILFCASSIIIHAQNDSTKKYEPHAEGTIRAKYEYNSSLDAHRFQVRSGASASAEVSAPSHPIKLRLIFLTRSNKNAGCLRKTETD